MTTSQAHIIPLIFVWKRYSWISSHKYFSPFFVNDDKFVCSGTLIQKKLAQVFLIFIERTREVKNQLVAWIQLRKVSDCTKNLQIPMFGRITKGNRWVVLHFNFRLHIQHLKLWKLIYEPWNILSESEEDCKLLLFIWVKMFGKPFPDKQPGPQVYSFAREMTLSQCLEELVFIPV